MSINYEFSFLVLCIIQKCNLEALPVRQYEKFNADIYLMSPPCQVRHYLMTCIVSIKQWTVMLNKSIDREKQVNILKTCPQNKVIKS